MPTLYKVPESVLVVIYAPGLDVLLMERADHAGFWQSVTGSKDHAREPLAQTCTREVLEETGINVGSAGAALHDWRLTNSYDIYPQWRHRYAPGVMRNTEHVFGLALPARAPITLNPREHTAHKWLPWREAAEQCFSPSNAEAILLLPRFVLVS